MKKILYSLVITLTLTIHLKALPSVAICGWDGTSGDEFTFVLLRDFAAGEVIYFTEDEYSDASGNFNFSEGHVAYTVPAGGLLENEVVGITESGTNSYSVLCSVGGSATHVASSGDWSFTTTDELYAYSASSAATPWSTVTEVHCFAWFSNTMPLVDQDPSNDWPNFIYIAFNIGGTGSNADFIDGFRVNTTLAMLQNGSNWAQSTGGITLSCTDFTNNMLPIELVSFDARLRRGEVLLDWTTESEVNNERFEIEHSTDGKIFTSVGSVAGSGTSNRKNVYKMIHAFPNLGINYYRLKQIDYDGDFSHSDIEVVNFYNDKNNNIISAYPNPFNQVVTLQFSTPENSSTGKVRTIEVYNIYGQLVLSSKIPMDEINTTLDLSKLNSGTYFLQTLDGQYSLTKIQRIIKL